MLVSLRSGFARDNEREREKEEHGERGKEENASYRNKEKDRNWTKGVTRENEKG